MPEVPGRSPPLRAERIALRVAGFAFAAIGTLPRSLGIRGANLLGLLAFGLARGLRRRAEANLRAAFPDRPEEWIREVAIDAFRNRLVTGFELMRVARHGLEGLPPLDWEGRERLVAGLESERGLMLISGHLGDMWLIPLAVCALGQRPAMLADLVSPSGRFSVRGIFRAYLYRVLLPSAGVSIVDATGGGARRAMGDLLARGEALLVLGDLPVGRVARDTFLGMEHPVPAGLADVAMDAGARFLPIFTRRLEDGDHRIAVEPEIPLEPGGAEAAMRAYLELLAQELRQAPSQWLWFHRHWPQIDRQLAGSG